MAEYQDKTSVNQSEEEVLKTAHERFKLGAEAWREIYDLAEEDTEFVAGEQWPEAIRQLRESEKRPILTINRLPATLNQITNDQRQNRPSIKVAPVDDKADPETAKILQGTIRHILRNSNADVCLDTAFEQAAQGGIGFYGLHTDYEDPFSFNLDIKFRRLPDFRKVLLDPFFKEPDGSDAAWGFIFDDIPQDDYVAEYGESKLAQRDFWDLHEKGMPDWFPDKSCRVAEYFTKEFKTVEICQLPDGQVVELKEAIELFGEAANKLPRRKTKVPTIKWYKLNAVEILEQTELPGHFIPIIPVLGKEIIVRGRRRFEGIVRHAKDPQKMLNFWATAETEMIALAPKAPFIVAEGQIPKQYEGQWKTANSRSWAYLTYKPTDHKGTVMPPPQRNTYEPPVAAITNARLQSSEDLKATTGIFDAALGARSNETSGVAIAGRQRQAQTANFHLIDNLTHSIRHAGRILTQWMPVVYDTARVVRIIGEEDEESIVRINQIFNYKGEERRFDFTVGKYDVFVETGPSFATKRQEAAASMLEMSKANPQIMGIAGDLVVKNMDWPGAGEIAERIKKTLPPGIAEDKEQKPLPPEVQAQMQQMNQMIEQLTAQLNETTETLKTKKMELESKERIEAMKAQTDLILKQMDLQGAAANQVFIAELENIKRRLALLDAYQPINAQFEDTLPPQQPQQFQNQNPEFQNFNELSPDQATALSQQQQQPTGGASPGQPMEF